MENQKNFAARFPGELYERMAAGAKEQSEVFGSKVSVNDWLNAAAREKLGDFSESLPGAAGGKKPAERESGGKISKKTVSKTLDAVSPAGATGKISTAPGYDDPFGVFTEQAEAAAEKNLSKPDPVAMAGMRNVDWDKMVVAPVSDAESHPSEMRAKPVIGSKAAELAAILGIKTGATIDEVEPRMLAGDAVFAVQAPEPFAEPELVNNPPFDPTSGPGRDRFWWKMKLEEIGRMDPAEAMRELTYQSGGVKIPRELYRAPEKLAVWLAENAKEAG